MEEDFPAPKEGMLLTVEDIDRSRTFYRDVLGVTVMRFLDNRLIITGGRADRRQAGGDDGTATRSEPCRRGADFLTPPIGRGVEVRRYIRDPDGHLIEVGQTAGLLKS